jgi:hypothetical protein
MWNSFYAGHPLLELPLLSMMLFAISFAGAVFFGFRVKRDDPIASLPLSEDDQ